MRYFNVYLSSLAYLKKINGLDSDSLYPGQTLKVARRKDFTVNKDVEEDQKIMMKQSPSEPDNKLIRNNEGEISDLDAIQAYLSSTIL